MAANFIILPLSWIILCIAVPIIVFAAFAEYFLMEPSAEYSRYMSVVREKTFMSNLVISFLIENEAASYEDLLQRLEVCERCEVI